MDIKKLSLFTKLKSSFSKLIKFYISALKDIDKEYNLVLEDVIFSPKHQKKVPLLRLLGSGGYIIETAESIIKHDKYKCHLHPDDLLKINKLADENKDNTNIVQKDISGEIYLSNGEKFNIFKNNLDSIDLNKLFSLPKEEVTQLLEQRGIKQGREISNEILQLKNNKIHQRRQMLKLVKNKI